MNLRVDGQVERRRRALLDDLRGEHRRERSPAALREKILERFAPQPSDETWAGSVGVTRVWVARVCSRCWPAARPFGSWSLASLALGSFLVLVLVGARLLSGAGAPFAIITGQDPATRDSAPADPGGSGLQPSLAVGPEPNADARRTRGDGSVPGGDAPGGTTPSPGTPSRGTALTGPRDSQLFPRACPIFEVPSGAMIAARKTDAAIPVYGLSLHTFVIETPSCGPLERRYLQLPPTEALPAAARPRPKAPVLLVLHGSGSSAELMRVQSRWRFDELARREGLIVIYANAAPGSATNVAVGNSGSWQTDPRAHPEVDDEDYLERVLGDLIVRHVIDGRNDVYLVGYGEGGTMALSAAVRRPNSYVGVAAILPSKPDAIAPPVIRATSRLSRVLLLVEDESTLDVANRMLMRSWARAFRITGHTVERHRRPDARAPNAARVEQLDAAFPASGSAAVRMLVVHGPFDPFPAPSTQGGASARSGGRSHAELDAAREAWVFLSGADNVGTLDIEDERPPIIADGTSVRFEDGGFEDPPVVLGDDVVVMPSPRR